MAVMPERRAMPQEVVPLLEWALWYAWHGWKVFPCKGKEPRIKGGFHNATTDETQIREWWTRWPGADIGIPTGQGFWVLDVDVRNGGDVTLRALEQGEGHGELPRTVQCNTGMKDGSVHLYWLGTAPHKAGLGEGLDVLCVGGYVIAPPSLHAVRRKNRYEWECDYSPDTGTMIEAPAWLIQLLESPQAPAGAQHASGTGTTFDPRAWLAQPWTIYDGERNDTLFHLTSFLHKQGKPMNEVYPLILGYNTLYCSPPMTVAEIDATMMRSVPQYEVNAQLLVAGAAPANDITWKVGDPPPAAQPPTLHFTDLADMLERTYPLPQWLIQDLIPEGLVFFAGSPKSSKTYLAYSLALSLVLDTLGQQPWLGQYPILNPGPVVYFTLEDDEADSWQRIKELMPGLTTIDRGRVIFHHGYDLPPLGSELVGVLRDQVIATYKPAMIVLDPMSYLYPQIRKGADQFSEVKDMLLPLRWLGKEQHCTILGIDHRRKKSADDVDIFETTYGSNAKPAIADSMLMIIREAQEITIHARVRKAQDQTLTLAFTFDMDGSAHWTWKGAIDGLLAQGQYGDLRQKVIESLSGFQQPMSMADLVASLNIPDSRTIRQNIYNILFRAQKNGEVQKTTRGQYVWAGGN